MELAGRWLAAPADDELLRVLPDPDYDDQAWQPVAVPGHWRSQPGFEDADGPVLYRHRFTGTDLQQDQRAWLTFHGLFYQSDIWLDGSYLGDTEGYFAPQTFEIGDHLRQRAEHLLAVELSCAPPPDLRHKRNLTGVFQHWDAIDPAFNPGGIWAPVTVTTSGPVRLATLRVRCREATAERATLDIQAILDADQARAVTITTTVGPHTEGSHPRREHSAGGAGENSAGGAGENSAGEHSAGGTEEHKLAAGPNRVRWRLSIDGAALWWPRALGEQPLHDVTVDVRVDGQPSDHRVVTTGLRQVRMHSFVTRINGERLFLKGANLGPTRRALAEATPDEVRKDVALACAAGLDLVRVHGHIGPPELYAEADRVGLLVWQDLPLQWAYGPVRRQAVRQARQAVDLLGHHPAIVMWCGHDEPAGPGSSLGAGAAAGRRVRAAFSRTLPSRNRTVLDRSVRRALERADGSRPVIAHAGVPPHPAGGTDTHLSPQWEAAKGKDLARTLARWPVLARFVGSFGPAAVPATAAFMDPASWPKLDWSKLDWPKLDWLKLDWDDLGRSAGLDPAVFADGLAPADHASFEAWRDATQRHQAAVIRNHVEILRRLKYRPAGGFCQSLLADAQPAVSRALLDHDRVAKDGYGALRRACAPVIVVADQPLTDYPPGAIIDLAVHVVSDLRHAIDDVEATARLTWPGGTRRWCWAGAIPADSCVRIGRIGITIPGDAPPGPLRLDIALRWPDEADPAGAVSVTNAYDSRIVTAPVRT